MHALTDTHINTQIGEKKQTKTNPLTEIKSPELNTDPVNLTLI